MKTILFIPFFIVSFCFSQPTIQWQKSLGGTGEEQARCIRQTSDGGYITVGTTKSNDGDISGSHLYEGNPYWDAWVIKLDANGEIEWQKPFGGSEGDNFNSIIQTSDGGYVACGYTESQDGDVIGGPNTWLNRHYWVVKMSTTGEIEWQNCGIVGVQGCEAWKIKQTVNGYVIVGTCYAVTGTFGYGDGFVMTLDSEGHSGWQTVIGETWYSDNLFSIDMTNNGGYIAAGSKSPIGGGDPGFDYYLVKLTAGGAIEWEKTYGGSKWEESKDIVVPDDGGFTLVGYTDSNDLDVTGFHENDNGNIYGDVWILHTDSFGNIIWQKCYGGIFDDRANSIQKTSDGYIIVGYTSSDDGDVTFNNGSYDYWMLKIDSSGNLLWQKSIGGSGYDEAFSICLTADNGYAVLGNTLSSGGGDVTFNNGFQDFWVAKLTNENLPTSKNFQDPLSIYPNPVSTDFHITKPVGTVIDEISIYDISGRVVKTEKGNITQINIEEVTAGHYVLEIRSGERKYFNKFIKI